MTISRNLSFLAEGVSSSGVLGATYGGTGQSSITTGDLLYGSASNTISKLAIGSTGTILRVVGGVPSWGTDYTGTVTSVAATVPSFLSIFGSPITTSGTLAITYSGTALPIANGGTGLTSLTAGQILYGSFSQSSNLTYNGTNLQVNSVSTNGLSLQAGPFYINGYSSASYISGQASLSSGGVFTAQNSGSGTIGFLGSGDMTFYTNSGLTSGNTFSVSERMRIFASGGVSIGNTTDPGASNLSVTGSLGVAATVGLGGGKISTLADLNAVNGLVIRDSATTYGNTNNFVLLQNSTGGTAGALTHTASQNLGVWSVGAIQFLTNTGATEAARIFQSGGVSIGNTTDKGAASLNVSGLIFPQQAATASAPAYQKGAIYFDTTLNKLRVGGATAWETITSV